MRVFIKQSLNVTLTFFIVVGWIFSGHLQIFDFPPPIKTVHAVDTIVFHEACDRSQADITVGSPLVGTTWNARVTLFGTPTTQLNSGTVDCTTQTTNNNIGYGHTMDPAPTTEEYFIDYVWNDTGNMGAGANMGALLNYIGTADYYACFTEDDTTPDVVIYKITGDVGTVLVENTDQTIDSGDQLECRIDYNGGTDPTITLTNVTDSATLASVTDSSSPLTETRAAGFFCGALPDVKETNDCDPDLTVDEIRLQEVSVAQDPFRFELGTHRWFQNLDATEPGLSATLNTPIVTPAQGNPFRLRLNLHVLDADLGISGTTSKLQFGEKIGATCEPAGDETYANVTTSSAISYHDNTGVTDNAAISAHNFDPRHSSSTNGVNDPINLQNYNDGTTDTTFTNAESAINQDEDGLWDFSLKDNSAPAGTSYCFRVVQDGGGVIDDYGTSTLPELRTRREVRVHIIGKVRLRKVRLTGI